MTTIQAPGEPELLTPAAAAALLAVHPRTLARRSDAGLIAVVRVDNGHRRYPRTVIEQLRSENS